jgi:hypothetical protein
MFACGILDGVFGIAITGNTRRQLAIGPVLPST